MELLAASCQLASCGSGGYLSAPLKTDSHLNQASNEYSEAELKSATDSFHERCLLGSGSFGKVPLGASQKVGKGTFILPGTSYKTHTIVIIKIYLI